MNKKKIILTSIVWSVVALFLIIPVILIIPTIGIILLLAGMVAWTIISLEKIRKAS